ncbi:MAG: helicase-exonuclease AddAB subunit AddA [Oscillospiraceae bacterium]|jgi:ATP-dependent helicase/nuclease subunit A|nr:helicase-exonuclease AddAB subunit AddA [Oscillospiraceae bacterium]
MDNKLPPSDDNFSFEPTPSQRDAILARNRELLVSAAAGSGKTRVLTERVIARVETEGYNVTDFLVITFTRAAAAELRDRIMKGLNERVTAKPHDLHLRRQLSLVSAANIMTIDSFCNMIVAEFSYKLGVRSSLRIAEGAQADLIQNEALENAVEQIFDSGSDPDIHSFIENMSGTGGDRALSSAVIKGYHAVQSHPFPDIWMTGIREKYDGEVSGFDETVWGRCILTGAKDASAYMQGLLETALEALRGDPVLYERYESGINSYIALGAKLAAALERGWDAAAAVLTEAPGRLGTAPRGYPDEALKTRVQSIAAEWKDCFKKLSLAICDSSPVHLEETRRLAAPVRGLFKCIEIFGTEYRRLKSAVSCADFNDLGHMAAELLCIVGSSGEITASETGELVGSRFAEVLVDEFQDTNRIQQCICDALTGGRHNLFMVGDVKQSIYRFRLAEPAIFLGKAALSLPYSPALPEKQPAVIALSENFRSRPEVIGTVNFLFTQLMTGGFTGISYDSGARLNCGGKFDDTDSGPFLTELHILSTGVSGDPSEDAGGEEGPGRPELEAKAAAERIRELLDSGFMVTDKEVKRRVRPGDITILLRSVKGKAWLYEEALSALGIPSCCGAMESERTAETDAVISLLSAADNPYNDIPLIAAMRSPMFGFTSDELAGIRLYSGRGSFYDAVKLAAEAGNARCAHLLASLADLRRHADDLTCDRLIWHIYSQSGIVGIFSAMKNGMQRRANLLLLYEYARDYTENGGYGLTGFLTYINKLFESNSFAGEAAASENAVQIMSIHKSKGLEFPVCVLCDLAKKFNLDDTRGDLLIHPELGIGLKLFDSELMYRYPSAVHSAISMKLREEAVAEELRVLYVAMTRAKEKLILFSSFSNADKSIENLLAFSDMGQHSLKSAQSYMSWLIPVLASHPDAAQLRKFNPSYPCDHDEKSRLHVRVSYPSRAEDSGVSDTYNLTAAEKPAAPVRDVPESRYLEKLTRSLEFTYPHSALSRIPTKLTATQLKGRAKDEEVSSGAPSQTYSPTLVRPRFAMEFLPGRDAGKAGTRLSANPLTPAERGTALHAAMQYINYNRCGDAPGVEEELSRLVAMKLLTAEQADSIDPRLIAGFISSPLYKRIEKSAYVEREFKFTVLEDAGVYYDGGGGEKLMLQGVCDLFFLENGGLVVVDFKTDSVTPLTQAGRAADYAPQLHAYSSAISRIFSAPVFERLIYFFGTGETVAV